MPVQLPNGQLIDDEVSNAILTLARLPEDQEAIPQVLVDLAKATKIALGLVDLELQ